MPSLPFRAKAALMSRDHLNAFVEEVRERVELPERRTALVETHFPAPGASIDFAVTSKVASLPANSGFM